MKIALYISDLNRGGAQRVIVNLANHLDDIGNEVLIITTIDKETSYHINKGVRVTTLNYDYYERKKEPKIERVLGIGKHLIRLKNILRKFKTEVVITFLTFEINCILSIKPFIKSKLIISVRNDPKMIYRTDYQIKRANLMFRLADGIVFQTKEAQSFFLLNFLVSQQ